MKKIIPIFVFAAVLVGCSAQDRPNVAPKGDYSASSCKVKKNRTGKLSKIGMKRNVSDTAK